MTESLEIKKLLNTLEAQSGIAFHIDSCSLSEDELIKKLKSMIKSCKPMDSKEVFLRDFLLGNITCEDAIRLLPDYHMKKDICRLLILISFKQPYNEAVISILSGLYGPASNELIKMDEHHIVLIHHLQKSYQTEELEQIAYHVADTLSTEAMLAVKIAYHHETCNFTELPGLYQDTVASMKIGSLFHQAQQVYCYASLGLGKLIYRLPKDACEAYLEEELHHVDFDALDEEMIHTIHTFFHCGLSIAETARALFTHRNTLVYRLEKIEKTIGLDIRNFDDAVTCKIAMMLWEYLHNED